MALRSPWDKISKMKGKMASEFSRDLFWNKNKEEIDKKKEKDKKKKESRKGSKEYGKGSYGR